MQLKTKFIFNSIVWISSLDKDEAGPTRRMIESINNFFDGRTPIEHLHANSSSELKIKIGRLAIKAMQNGMRPMIVIDMHGNKDKGVRIAKTSEFVPWRVLSNCLRGLNIATKNNLVVISHACFGLHAISPISINEAAPFYVLLAPEKEVKVGFLEDNCVNFFKELVNTGIIDVAYNKWLKEKFEYFHCEEMLFISMAKYIDDGCKGKTAKERRERLLSEAVDQGLVKNLADARRTIKKGLNPTQKLLDKYSNAFLLDRNCSFKIDEILAALEDANRN